MVRTIHIGDAKRPVGNLQPKVMSKIKLSKAESQSTIEKVFSHLTSNNFNRRILQSVSVSQEILIDCRPV
jgi:hypothetical protein